ncbi:elongation factor P [Iris pallida]|uniref:Elongation factor P n=1 Tax=Iris pallida TaxID=29817 RepID=A0AAX6H659_IRIPA|nr:elongation factor P [Iris pallida]KAJ6836466.1 elongation factor P [Iris pallida]
MLAARRRLFQNLLLSRPHSSSSITTLTRGSPRTRDPANGVPLRGALAAPWAAVQRRTKFLGADVRSGNVIERKGRVYQVIKAEHTQQGRGGATIQVELRDLDSGNKVTERFRTNEALERVFVEEKSYTFLYADGDTITLMEPETFEQLDVSRELFGKSAVYLQDEMTVKLQLFDGKVMSASVPHRVTCTVVQAHSKGQTAAPQYKKVILDNGLTVDAPPFVKPGERIVINTTDDSYMTRAKE